MLNIVLILVLTNLLRPLRIDQKVDVVVLSYYMVIFTVVN